jgi:hypothetical protein
VAFLGRGGDGDRPLLDLRILPGLSLDPGAPLPMGQVLDAALAVQRRCLGWDAGPAGHHAALAVARLLGSLALDGPRGADRPPAWAAVHARGRAALCADLAAALAAAPGGRPALGAVERAASLVECLWALMAIERGLGSCSAELDQRAIPELAAGGTWALLAGPFLRAAVAGCCSELCACAARNAVRAVALAGVHTHDPGHERQLLALRATAFAALEPHLPSAARAGAGHGPRGAGSCEAACAAALCAAHLLRLRGCPDMALLDRLVTVKGRPTHSRVLLGFHIYTHDPLEN